MHSVKLEELIRLSVKITLYNLPDKLLGTGTIISDGKKFYVMTAAHCIEREKDSRLAYETDEISIYNYIDNSYENIPIIKIEQCIFENNKDFALIEIEPISNAFDYFNRIKCCDSIINQENYYFFGYTQIAPHGRLFPVKRSGTSTWHLSESNISNQELRAIDLMSGNSGAGIFFKRYGIYYCVGFVKAIIDLNGSYNDFKFRPISLFYDLLPDSTRDNIVDLVHRWNDLDDEDLINNDLIEHYKNENIEYMYNLERKIGVLFPDDNVSVKTRLFLEHYLKGISLIRLIGEKPILQDKLKKSDQTVFDNFEEYRSSLFNDSKEARDDLKEIRKGLIDVTSKIVKFDDETNKIATDYANYSIANRLLICTLDYKNK